MFRLMSAIHLNLLVNMSFKYTIHIHPSQWIYHNANSQLTLLDSCTHMKEINQCIKDSHVNTHAWKTYMHSYQKSTRWLMSCLNRDGLMPKYVGLTPRLKQQKTIWNECLVRDKLYENKIVYTRRVIKQLNRFDCNLVGRTCLVVLHNSQNHNLFVRRIFLVVLGFAAHTIFHHHRCLSLLRVAFISRWPSL